MRRYSNGTDVVEKARKAVRRNTSKARWSSLAKPFLFALAGVAAGFGAGLLVRSRA